MLPGTVTTSDGAERIGVFGGTFDPIHVAHVVSAVEARRVLSLDRVVLVPAGDPWQKRGSVAAPATDRLAMVEAAVDGIAGLDGWRVEHVQIPHLEISSTDLRARAARGWPLDGLVPPGAVRVIAERELYRS